MKSEIRGYGTSKKELLKESNIILLDLEVNGATKLLGQNEFGKNIYLKNGRFGPYITNGKVNAKIPKDVDPKSLDENTCIELIKNAPKRKFRRKFRAKKTT